VTPKLEYLQAKWAAHLPYRQATELLRQILPLDKGISFGSTRRRILASAARRSSAISPCWTKSGQRRPAPIKPRSAALRAWYADVLHA